MTTAIAAVVFASLVFNAGYYATAAGLFGCTVVAGTASALLLGARPSTPSRLAASALVALGVWSAASVWWGGLPGVAWRFAALTVTAAAAVLLGSSLGDRLRDPTWDGVLAGLTAHAVTTLALVGSGHAPSGWFVGRQLEGTVGYHNALGAAYALGLPLAVRVAVSNSRARRAVGGACAVALIATAVLTQSRGTLLAIVVALVVQAALARRARVAATALLLAPTLAALLLQLREVDAALVNVIGTARRPEVDPLTHYALTAFVCAAVTAGLAALSTPPVLRSRRMRRAAVVVGSLAVAGALVASVAVIASRASDLIDRVTAQPNSPSQVAGGETRLSSLSTTGRIEQWRLALRMIGEEPLIGHGAGTFAARWGRDRTDQGLYVLQPHSLELETVVEQGLVGGALLAIFIGGMAWSIVRGVGRDALRGGTAAAAAVAFLTLASVDWVFSFPLLLAATLLIASSAGGAGSGRSLPAAWCIAGALVGFTILAGPALGHWYLQRATAAAETSLPKASRLAERARAFNPWDAAIVSYQGRIAEGLMDYERAASLYARASELSQQPWTDRYREARAFEEAGQRAASSRACRDATRSNPLEEELRRGVCARVSVPG